MTELFLAPDKSTLYFNPCRVFSDIHSAVESLGGFMEVPQSDVMSLPLSNKAAKELRVALTGKPVSLSPEVGLHLKHLADDAETVAGSNVFISHNRKFSIVDSQWMTPRQYNAWRSFWSSHRDAISVINEGVFSLPLTMLPELADSVPSLSFSPDALTMEVNDVIVRKQAEASTLPVELEQEPALSVETFQTIELPDLLPFKNYDRTLASLKEVSVKEYLYVKEDAAKVLKSKAKKKPVPLYQKLQKFGIETAFDVLHHFPIRHVDRSNPQLIKTLQPGDEATVLGRIVSRTAYNYQKNYIRFIIEDSAGTRMGLTFFHQQWLQFMFYEGDEVIAYGKFAPFNGSPSLADARMDKIGDKRAQLPMIPVYRQSEKLKITTWDLMSLLKETLGRLSELELRDPISDEVKEKYRIPSRAEAYRAVHFPKSKDEFSDANRRLIYEELLRLQLYIQQQKYDVVRRVGIAQNATVTPSLDAWMTRLPYELTNAQKRAAAAIRENMASPSPMHRLVQGDVGAGKSSIASITVFLTVDNGHQAALLAPTEILAEQLHNGIASDAEGLINPHTGKPINIKFLGGKTRAKEAREIREGLANGDVDVVVGTHAILTESTTYHDLGTVVIDEQHRFGVEQRTRLRNVREDGLTPDMLVMTATPIPRSSAMVLYGDLDITVLDELPPGRTPIETIWLREEAQTAIHRPNLRAWQDIKEQIAAGHQAYIVASLVEDNEKIAAQSVEDAYESLSNGAFKGYRLGMVHGKQKRDEREATMKSFAAGEIDILVATTVIEVGVNVPNTTIMVVLDPGRFGIAQLHQIRGRVGRSKFASRCYLVGETKTDEGEFRLNALVESTDGFYLSEKDLELRGEGQLFGDSQSGDSDLFIANIRDHLHILEVAKEDAVKIITADPDMKEEGNALFKSEIHYMFRQKDIKS